jgi:hypothetical protein
MKTIDGIMLVDEDEEWQYVRFSKMCIKAATPFKPRTYDKDTIMIQMIDEETPEGRERIVVVKVDGLLKWLNANYNVLKENEDE